MLYILRESKKSTYIFTCIPIHTYALYRDTYTYMHTYVHIDMPTAPIRFTLPFDSARAGARRNIDWLLAYFVVTQANALFEIRYWEKVRESTYFINGRYGTGTGTETGIVMEKGALERKMRGRMKRRLHIQANHSDTQTKTIFGMRNQIVIKINNEKKK